MNVRKELLARVLHAVRADQALLAWQREVRSPYVRAVNYHDVPPNLAVAFERQLAFYRDAFEPVDLTRLKALLAGQWELRRPGLLLSFDDGLRSHAEVVAPLLDRYRLTGWFMVPGGFIETEPQLQAEFARAHLIKHSEFDYGDSRLAMKWDDVRDLSRCHVVGCHTWTHRRLSDGLSRQELEFEVGEAKARLEEKVRGTVEVFAWVGGEEWSYSQAAAEAVREAGFTFSLMTNSQAIRPGSSQMQLQRTNIEADYSDALTRFQLSGVMDVLYAHKRRRVNRSTAGA